MTNLTSKKRRLSISEQQEHSKRQRQRYEYQLLTSTASAEGNLRPMFTVYLTMTNKCPRHICRLTDDLLNRHWHTFSRSSKHNNRTSPPPPIRSFEASQHCFSPSDSGELECAVRGWIEYEAGIPSRGALYARCRGSSMWFKNAMSILDSSIQRSSKQGRNIGKLQTGVPSG